jgi:putative endonuclease
MRSTRDFIPAEEWSDARHRRGLWGERVAMAFLTSCGWYIEAHRFRLGHRDVDLVTRRGAVVAFVEVKTRRSTAWGAPSESVSWRKRRRIARVADVWRERYGRVGDLYRFDVVEVRLGPGGWQVSHLEDAWRLDGH